MKPQKWNIEVTVPQWMLKHHSKQIAEMLQDIKKKLENSFVDKWTKSRIKVRIYLVD